MASWARFAPKAGLEDVSFLLTKTDAEKQNYTSRIPNGVTEATDALLARQAALVRQQAAKASWLHHLRMVRSGVK